MKTNVFHLMTAWHIFALYWTNAVWYGIWYFHCSCSNELNELTHWGRVTHICVSELTIIGSDNGLSPGRRQAIIWTNDWLLLIGPLGTNFSEILIEILTFSFKKMRLKVSSAKRRTFCLGLNELNRTQSWVTEVYLRSMWSVYRANYSELVKCHR